LAACCILSLQNEGTVMRRWILSLCLVGLSSGAFAGDLGLPPLRGSSAYDPAAPLYDRWSGFYAGGHFGYGNINADLTDAFDALNVFSSSNSFTAPLGAVSAWAAFGINDKTASSYGGFFGYNSQWDEAVLGVEINYNRTSLRASQTSSRCYSDVNLQCAPAITLGDGNSYDVAVDATASARIVDYATLRGRAGWAYGNIMPYAMVGLAFGWVETSRTATASGTPTVPPGTGTAFTTIEGEVRTRYAWGFVGGLGVDVLLLPNVFLRAEYEYLDLDSVANIALNVSTVRAGIGVKF
jgi:opacity protein-like surface antigen